METSLHRDLKLHYAGPSCKTEVRLDKYRIDAVHLGRLFEIQHGSLSAIRDKVSRLLGDHCLTVVKPIVARKRLIKLAEKGGEPIERRWSPKRGKLLDLFDELIYFTRVFPHRRLTLEIALVEVEEWRYPGHGRRRRHRAQDHLVDDLKLVRICDTVTLKTKSDLRRLVNSHLGDETLPRDFHTGHLAAALAVRRHIAQRIAYTFRQMKIVKVVGKEGNAILYRF